MIQVNDPLNTSNQRMNNQHAIPFLAGGGEMGELIRAKDWTNTPVGAPDTWPQSLRTTLSIILNSKFPMFLFWGPQLICFYNDAYRPSLGMEGKHPNILGGRGEDHWKEIWPAIKPLIDQVLAGGEASWSEDQLLPIYRNGKLEDVYWTFSYSPVSDETGKPAGVFVTCSETTDKVVTHTKLEESNDQLLFAVEVAELGTWDFNPLANKFTSNSRLKEWFGLPETSEIELHHATDAIAEKDRQRVMDAIEKSLDYATGGIYTEEFSIIHPETKEERIIQARGRAYFNADNIAYRLNGTLADITQEAMARKKIEESEKRFRTMAESSDILIGVNDESVNAVYFNKVWEKLTGRPVADLINLGWVDLLHPDDRQPFLDKFLKAFENKTSYSGEFRILNKDGNYSWLYAKVQVRLHPDGSYAGHISSSIDITERKQTEEAIKRFKFMADNAVEPFILMRADGSFEYLNKAALEKWGYTIEEATQLRVPDVDIIYNDELFAADFAKAQQEELATFETFYKKKDGSIYPAEINMTTISLGGQPYMFAIARDITERKKTEDLLRQREQRLRSLVESTPFPIGVYVGREMRIEFVNESILKVWGRTYDVVGKLYAEVLTELTGQGVYEQLDAVFTTGIAFYAVNQRIDLLIDGKMQPYFFNYSFTPLYNELGEIYGVLNTAADVSDLNIANKKVEESEHRSRMAIEAANMGTFDWDLVTNEFASSQRLKDIFGFSGQPEITHQNLIGSFHPEDKGRRDEAVSNAATKGSLVYEARIIWPDKKTIRWVRVYGKVLYADQQAIKMYGTVADSTEEKTNLKALEESTTRLNIAMEATELGMWELDLKTDEMTYSPRYLEIFGYEKNATPDHATFLNKVHPDDLTLREKAFNKALQQGLLNYEIRLMHDDKSIHWIEAKGRVFYDEAKEPAKLIGTIRDITEKKHYEEELQESEQKFRLLADSMPQYIWTSDTDGHLNYFNKSVFDYTGLSNEAITKDGWLQFVHPDDEAANIQTWMNSVNTGAEFIFEHRFRRFDGDYRWHLSRAIPQRDAAGNIQMWVGSSTDIQEQKIFTNELERQVSERTAELEKVNDALLKSNSELEQFAYVASHDLQEPLRKIRFFTERLEASMGNADETSKVYYKKIENASERMKTLIGDLLNFSRLSKSNEVFEITDLNMVIENILHDLELSIEQKNALIEKGDLPAIESIPLQMTQLFYNILGNSLKFSRESIAPVIKISSSLLSNEEKLLHNLDERICYYLIEIKDNGIGFSQEYAEQIFVIFQRLNSLHAYGGTGIGLAICKKIVLNHKGKIYATAEEEAGATFHIILPKQQKQADIPVLN